MASNTSLFRWMLLEEYRLHTKLFGSTRFLAFPVFVAAIVGGGVYLLSLTGTSMGAVVAGLHALVVFFGLQVGTLGLVGRDAMRDVLGDVTLLVFSARTLPVSWGRLLATFLVKDLVYYAAFFLTPLVVGFVPVALAGGLSLGQVALLWVTLLGTFALGAAGSLALVGLGTRNRVALVVVVVALALLALFRTGDLVAVTPYAVYLDPSPATAVLALGPLVVAAALGPLLFKPASGGSTRRVRTDRYRELQRLPGIDGLTARPLLEVTRSSGSVWKVVFSLGVLFGVAALLLDRVAVATGIDPSAGVAFGTLLGLGSFTTFNWVTQFDDPQGYLRYPTGMDAVFGAKFRAHLAFAVPTGLAYLALAAVWYPVVELLVGVVVFPLVSVYVFGLTAYLTGLSANELLFDTPLFAAFGAGMALLAVPLLVASLAAGAAPQLALGGAVALSAVAALVGYALVGRAGPRWDEKMRTGE
ncbi:hypothetical protein [Salinibaculum rarum]|uniref:hypothetical protein n=1 Tax=Salinibaculum rarum TaxID=3058903 RepID=UPI0026604448|nr:hypothetical protein [Salinibaculum sp. KK48]